jgi:hypothetical protein
LRLIVVDLREIGRSLAWRSMTSLGIGRLDRRYGANSCSWRCNCSEQLWQPHEVDGDLRA